MSDGRRYASRDAYALRPPTAEAAMDDPFGRTALDPPRVLDVSGSPPAARAGEGEGEGRAATPARGEPPTWEGGRWSWPVMIVVAVLAGLLFGAAAGAWVALGVG